MTRASWVWVGVAVAAVGFAPSPAEACKLDAPRPFEVARVAAPSFASPTRIRVEVDRHASGTPMGGCAGATSVRLSATGLPPGRWGVVIEHQGKVKVPAWPIELQQGNATVFAGFDQGLLWRDGIDDTFEVSLVDEHGRRSFPQTVRVHSPGRPQFFGWALLAAVGLVVWGVGVVLRMARRL